MSRRQLQISEVSMTPSFKDDVEMTNKLHSHLSLAEETLSRSLSLKSVIPTTSSFASTEQAAQDPEVSNTYRPIGAGTCGTVFEIPGTAQVVKRAKAGWEDQLWNEILSQQMVVEAFKTHEELIGDLRVPYVVAFITLNDKEFWHEHAQFFPHTHRSPSALYVTQRIQPLPTTVRHALIDTYFPDPLKQSAKSDRANNHCLIRLYLGKRRDPERQKPTRATLVNYNLHLDQMEELGLETKDFAETMARGLAAMHWEAELDAEDVEFVLASAPTVMTPLTTSSAELARLRGPTSTTPKLSLDFHCKKVNMWVLDFNRCHKISIKGVDGDLKRKGLEMAISAFFKNDPYYPRPQSDNLYDQELWSAFEATYLTTSHAILSKDPKVSVKELPQEFIRGLVAEEKIRKQKKAAAEKRLLEKGSWENY